jgi:uncharacterized CHY-type Zn-finger protein
MLRVCTLILIMVMSLTIWVDRSVADVHLSSRNLPLGCATCHFRSNLKTGGGTQLCIVCHGSPQRLTTPNRNIPSGFAPPGMQLKNIEGVFSKLYRHPTFDLAGRHQSNETLPELDPKAPRHADCVDCHHPHLVTKENKFAGIKGKRVGNLIAEITNEYELCYRCHAESANLPGRYINKRSEFSLNNPSYHPVEGEGRNTAVISLIRPYKEKKVVPGDISVIKCTDCHNNDDPNGPKGPHGSNFRYILVDNYSVLDKQPENTYAYALCYKCHNRSSILANESFKYHSLHISGTSNINPNGTSCHTCHSSHGSTEYKNLIRFDTEYVTPSSSGILKYVEKGIAKFSGECYLTCHGVDHNPKTY